MYLGRSRLAESECSNGTTSHGIVMLFVGLDILAKLKLAVLGVIKFLPCHNFPRAHVTGHTVSSGEGMQPEHTLNRHLDHKMWQHVHKGMCCTSIACAP
jgi:hypothetical protein